MTNDLERIGHSLHIQAIQQMMTALYVQKTQAETLVLQLKAERDKLKEEIAKLLGEQRAEGPSAAAVAASNEAR